MKYTLIFTLIMVAYGLVIPAVYVGYTTLPETSKSSTDVQVGKDTWRGGDNA